MRRTAIALLLVALVVPLTSATATAAPSGGTDHLDSVWVSRAAGAMDALGVGYGTTVGHGDLYWFAQRLDVPVGTHVNEGDLRRLVGVAEALAGTGPTSPPTSTPTTPTPSPTATPGPAGTPVTAPGDTPAYAALAPWFAPLGVGFGTWVNAADVVALGRWTGVPTATRPTDAQAAAIGVRAEARAAEPHPVTLRWNGLDLVLPSTGTEMIGFHQSNHDGARPLSVVTPRVVPTVLMEDRGRDTVRRGAADIVVGPGADIVAPVTGTVKRAGTYTLYCRYSDDFLVVEPDGRRGIEVKLLHIDRVRVRAGDRVVAGATVVAEGPTPLPFESQIDELSAAAWPHVHLEVVDTSIPDRPSSGGSGC